MSLGTRSKAPSLFREIRAVLWHAELQSEDSIRLIRIGRRLLDDRLTITTFFVNRFANLIDFSSNPVDCSPRAPFFGCYVNRDRARTSGIQGAANLDLMPQWLRVNVAYTHLNAIDLETGEQLPRRPSDEARIGFAFTPVRNLSIEPAIILVGQRYSGFNEAVIWNQEVKLAPYARLDVYANTDDDTFSVLASAENLTNAHYQEVYDSGTAGDPSTAACAPPGSRRISILHSRHQGGIGPKGRCRPDPWSQIRPIGRYGCVV